MVGDRRLHTRLSFDEGRGAGIVENGPVPILLPTPLIPAPPPREPDVTVERSSESDASTLESGDDAEVSDDSAHLGDAIVEEPEASGPGKWPQQCHLAPVAVN